MDQCCRRSYSHVRGQGQLHHRLRRAQDVPKARPSLPSWPTWASVSSTACRVCLPHSLASFACLAHWLRSQTAGRTPSRHRPSFSPSLTQSLSSLTSIRWCGARRAICSSHASSQTAGRTPSRRHPSFSPSLTQSLSSLTSIRWCGARRAICSSHASSQTAGILALVYRVCSSL